MGASRLLEKTMVDFMRTMWPDWYCPEEGCAFSIKRGTMDTGYIYEPCPEHMAEPDGG